MGHRFSDEVIAAYERGDENYIYTDWYNTVFKKATLNQQYNVSLTGGNELVDYYIGGNFTNDNSVYKSKSYGYERYSFNANVGVRLTKDLSARYTTTFRQSTNNTPGSYDVDWNLLYYVYSSDPMVGVTTKQNPSHYTVVDEEFMNPAALLDTETAGYYTMDNKTFNNNLELTYQAPFLKGLRFTANGAFDFERNKSRMLIKRYPLYDYATDEIAGWFREETQYGENWSDRRRLYGRVQALYDNHFGKQRNGHAGCGTHRLPDVLHRCGPLLRNRQGQLAVHARHDQPGSQIPGRKQGNAFQRTLCRLYRQNQLQLRRQVPAGGDGPL
jgi:hypothetical protein